MKRQLLAGAAGAAVLVVGLVITGVSIVLLEVVEIFPDVLSLVALPGGGLFSLAAAGIVALAVYRRGEEPDGAGG